MTKIYRVKPIFNHLGGYSKYYVIQKQNILGYWRTISPPTNDKESAEKDCDEAQRLYDKYSNS